MADEAVVEGKILEWGNTYGIRVKKSDLEKAGLAPGTEVVVRLERRSDRVDVSGFPFVRGGDPDDAARHDELLGQARLTKGARGKRDAARR